MCHKILQNNNNNRKIQYLLKSGRCASLIKSVSLWFKSYPEAAAESDVSLQTANMTSSPVNNEDLNIWKTNWGQPKSSATWILKLLTCSHKQESLSSYSWIAHLRLLWLMLMLVIKRKKRYYKQEGDIL